MKQVRRIFDFYLDYKISENPTEANSNDADFTKIKLIITICYALKTFKIMLVISNITYFLGLSWLIFC